MKVFLDANLIFSAAQSGSLSTQFLRTLCGCATVVTHPSVWHEAERNIRDKRPEWEGGLQAMASLISLHAGMAHCPAVGLPEKDQPVLGGAISAGADYLVTGDRAHFGPLFGQTVQGVTILSPRMMAEEMQKQGWVGRGE